MPFLSENTRVQVYVRVRPTPSEELNTTTGLPLDYPSNKEVRSKLIIPLMITIQQITDRFMQLDMNSPIKVLLPACHEILVKERPTVFRSQFLNTGKIHTIASELYKFQLSLSSFALHT